MYEEAFIPAVWTYMGNKSTPAYIRILTTVRDSIFSATGRAWMPEVVIIDHEAAVLAALRYAFPGMYFVEYLTGPYERIRSMDIHMLLSCATSCTEKAGISFKRRK